MQTPDGAIDIAVSPNDGDERTGGIQFFSEGTVFAITVRQASSAAIGRPLLPPNDPVVNAASFDRSLAPGALATVFGFNLSNVTSGVLTGGATSYEGTTIMLNNTATPTVSFATSESGLEQASFQVPTDIFGGRAYQFSVERPGGTADGMATVGVFLPGVFEFALDGETYGVFIHQDGRVVTPDAPAMPNEIITAFYTGGGAVEPAVATGELASGIHRTTRAAVVTINGAVVPMLFSGLTPGFFGLYQANFEMNGAAGGTAEFVIDHAGAKSKPVNLAVGPRRRSPLRPPRRQCAAGLTTAIGPSQSTSTGCGRGGASCARPWSS